MVVLHVSSTCVSGEPLPPSAADSTSSQQRHLLQHHPPLFLPALPPTDWEPMWWTRTQDRGEKKQCVKQQHKWKSTEVKAFDFRAVVMEALPRKGRLEAGGHFKTPQLLRSECFRCFYRVLPSLPVKFWNAGVCHRRLGEFPDYVASPDCSFETEAKIDSKMKS